MQNRNTIFFCSPSVMLLHSIWSAIRWRLSCSPTVEWFPLFTMEKCRLTEFVRRVSDGVRQIRLLCRLYGAGILQFRFIDSKSTKCELWYIGSKRYDRKLNIVLPCKRLEVCPSPWIYPKYMYSVYPWSNTYLLI